MHVAIVSTLTFPIPHPVHSGEASLILDLSWALTQLGHSVSVYAPEGSVMPEGVKLYPAPLAGLGRPEPTVEACERALISRYRSDLLLYDIVHDFSNHKSVASLRAKLSRPHIQTYLGAPYTHGPEKNCCVQSQAQADRASRGETDYVRTRLEHMGGPPTRPIQARPVWNGIDTEYYCPGDTPKEDFILWLGRWSPVRGYEEAIELAKANPSVPFVMAGSHPDDETFDSERSHAQRAQELAQGVANIDFQFLPPDPEHHDAKRELYRRAKAIIFPVLFNEPFGLMQIEAMACSTPCISCRLGSYPEISEYFLDDGLDLSGPFQTDLERTRTLFSREAMAERYLEAYQDVLTGQEWG